MPHTKILAVDDEPVFRFLLERQLREIGYDVVSAVDGLQALEILEQQTVDLVLSDLVMPRMDGLQLIGSVQKLHPGTPIIVITAHGSVESAVEAMRRGAYDYLEKPYDPEDLRITIRRALDYQRVVQENEQIKGLLTERFTFQSIVTVNPAMKQVLELASRVAAARQTTVAIYGESGSGKEVLARAIHFAGNGLPAEFVAVNCAAIPEHLMESELFGHVRGAFTGADRDREGKFSLARKGTILLDEIGDMPLPLQAKLLRVLQERVFEKIGSNAPIPVACRVIVATNRSLADLVAAGRFREDLYHRINVFPLTIPPLCQRKDDIPILCGHILEQLRQHLGKPLPGISQQAMELMLEYRWPGNVRELRNCLERAAIITDNELIRPSHLGLAGTAPEGTESIDAEGAVDASRVSYHLSLSADGLSLDALNEQILGITLQRCGGNKSKASQLLKVNRKAFYRS
ncbi:sigma-54 dependent transcriptional regulator [Geomonas sp. Red69]|uniref:Sigma-54 dependent transcriptional regulator n=1 Tax=Geomonas diazotrophica TaxID=2843197 RepID=A0ABX8JGV3_9BACT|nr:MULTISPECIES: sigma-54 dependent transcriptional regulator [Geomonas]MBU5637825.1 sigma-54 dependent transcriptional regulator [Geomonas diazotrophica]QWV96356.1 sigma-54 dependent transcriptional regulator [Geomonas nitrogeniifigens]